MMALVSYTSRYHHHRTKNNWHNLESKEEKNNKIDGSLLHLRTMCGGDDDCVCLYS